MNITDWDSFSKRLSTTRSVARSLCGSRASCVCVCEWCWGKPVETQRGHRDRHRAASLHPTTWTWCSSEQDVAVKHTNPWNHCVKPRSDHRLRTELNWTTSPQLNRTWVNLLGPSIYSLFCFPLKKNGKWKIHKCNVDINFPYFEQSKADEWKFSGVPRLRT